MVGEDILEPDVRVRHAGMRVLGIEDLDELGRSIAHDEQSRILTQRETRVGGGGKGGSVCVLVGKSLGDL